MLSKFKALWADSLYRNSFWLMAGSFSMAGIGFFYWMIAARLYTPEQIGLATTFLSAASLINGFAMLGLGQALLRYLPNSTNKVDKINTIFTIIIVSSLIFGLLYFLNINTLTPRLKKLTKDIYSLIYILFFLLANTLNGATDSVFISNRNSFIVFTSNIIQSSSKLIFLLLFSAYGLWGLINSNIFSTLLSTITCLVIINKKYGVKFYPSLNTSIISRILNFSKNNYIAGLIGSIPSYITPIIITNSFNPTQTAFFYVPNMIAALLTIIPSTFSKSYLTEGSNKKNKISFKKPLLMSLTLLVLSNIFLLIFGKFLLGMFGKAYYEEGFKYLLVLAFTTLVSSFNYFLGAEHLLNEESHIPVFVSIISTISFTAFLFFTVHLGTSYVAFSSLFSQSVCLISYLLIRQIKNG